jgi:hypothetical protein
MVASISSARSVAIRVFAFRYSRYGGAEGLLLLFRRSMAAFMFAARSFASPVMRSMASCCHGLATVRCDCRPRMFCCNSFASALIFSRAEACPPRDSTLFSSTLHFSQICKTAMRDESDGAFVLNLPNVTILFLDCRYSGIVRSNSVHCGERAVSSL